MDEPTAKSPETWIIDVDARNFEKEVVARSMDVPVVVDFWAEWCEPCKALSPILEKAAREGKGRFVLARIDVDANPELAQAFRVQSIPMVVGLSKGRLADAFQGAQPPAEVQAFLDRVAPGGSAVADDAASLAEAQAAEGDVEGAVAALREHLRSSPDDARARIVQAGLLVDLERVDDAKRVLARLSEEDAASSEGKAIAGRIDALEQTGDLDELRAALERDPEDAEARTGLGRALVARREYEAGLEELLEAVRLDPTGVGVEAKQAMLDAFDALGLEDAIANDYRFKLSLLLFS